ncbi:unnamed protein product [Cuscuta epithymum]|uniref:NAC domain-containing protein n=1 Tax=Cuscuta epithymum TaxID=186058 RepID=A0AAV0D3E2_9ASTE|nr:unnamed protein product [Cuscuta epithymum]
MENFEAAGNKTSPPAAHHHDHLQKAAAEKEIIREGDGTIKGIDDFSCLPPGFRFHPTDEEIIKNYLTQKVLDNHFVAEAIGEADLNKLEPWDLPKIAKLGERQWWFFYRRDRKYPTGMRTNRATGAGYWKATGKDKEIFTGRGSNCLIGMKKTLVFYRGRAPHGEKSNWIMHEFRLEGPLSYRYFQKSSSPREDWVVCKVFHKSATGVGELGVQRENNDEIDYSFVDDLIMIPTPSPVEAPATDYFHVPATGDGSSSSSTELLLNIGRSDQDYFKSNQHMIMPSYNSSGSEGYASGRQSNFCPEKDYTSFSSNNNPTGHDNSNNPVFLHSDPLPLQVVAGSLLQVEGFSVNKVNTSSEETIGLSPEVTATTETASGVSKSKEIGDVQSSQLAIFEADLDRDPSYYHGSDDGMDGEGVDHYSIWDY